MSHPGHPAADAEVLALNSDDDWDALLDRYPARPDRPLQRCLEVARQGGACCVVIEHDYHDDDYRSEYYAFFAQTFLTVPDGAQRLVFFDTAFAAEDLADIPEPIECVGYVTIRPHELGRVGRTVLRPPPDLADAVTTAITDVIHLFGQRYTIDGVPFMQQDKQLGRCAQAAAWMCHFSAFRREEDVQRRAVADFSLLADRSTAQGRMLPSDGLTVTQLSSLLDSFGLPPIQYRMGEMPTPDKTHPLPVGHDTNAHPGTWDHRAISVACRYLNSAYPVLVGTKDHAFVLCGYQRAKRNDREWIEFVRHDDQRGPYLRVDNILADEDPDTDAIYGPWETILAPVPRDVWLQPEAAEAAAREFIPAFAAYATENSDRTDPLCDALGRGDLSYRTYAISQNEFKARLVQRAPTNPNLMARLRFTRMSRMIWVVEAVDRTLRNASQPDCVIAEAIYDATSADDAPGLLALWGGGLLWTAHPVGHNPSETACSPDPTMSLAPHRS